MIRLNIMILFLLAKKLVSYPVLLDILMTQQKSEPQIYDGSDIPTVESNTY